MPKSSQKEKAVEDLTFEQAYAELEALVETLESEQRPLEETMTLYARGQALAQRCAALLDAATLKVQQLSGGALTDFDEED